MKSPKELKAWRNERAGKLRFMRIENVTPKMWAEHYVHIANEAAIEGMKPQWERDMEAANRLFDKPKTETEIEHVKQQFFEWYSGAHKK